MQDVSQCIQQKIDSNSLHKNKKKVSIDVFSEMLPFRFPDTGCRN